MDSSKKKLVKIIEEDKKQLTLESKEQLKSLGVNKFEDINLNLYNKVIVSQVVAKFLDLFQKSYQLSIKVQLFKIQRFVKIDRTKRLLKFYCTNLSDRYFRECVPQNPEQFDHIIIRYGYRNDLFETFVLYIKYFPNLKLLTINISKEEKYSLNFVESSKSIINFFKFVENIDIMKNELQYIKRNNNVHINQIVSNQKALNVDSLKGLNTQVIQKLDKFINLSNKNYIDQILQKVKERDQNVINIQTPRALKLFANNNQLIEAKQLAGIFPNISKIVLISKKEDQDCLDIFENFQNFIQSIQNLKKITFEDQNNIDFIGQHINMVGVCLQKCKDVKVNWLNKQTRMIIYKPKDQYLKIINKEDYYVEYNIFTSFQLEKLFQLYQNVQKVSINCKQDQLQNVIEVLNNLQNLKIATLCTQGNQDTLDFQPIYNINFQRIKVIFLDEFGQASTKSFLKSFESLLSHPSCPIIQTNKFTINYQLQQAYFQIRLYEYCEFFANLILNKCKSIQVIQVNYTKRLFWQSFFAKILTSSSLISIQHQIYEEFQNKTKYQQNDDDKFLYLIFNIIKVQKLQIKIIEKHIAVFIPIYLPSLIYDLFC